MLLKDVKKTVKKLQETHWDNEAAHCTEDELYLNFVSYCATDAPEPFKAIAKELLKTQKIDFTRWCA